MSSEQFTIFPVFILIDVSGSMGGAPIDAVNQSLPELKTLMETDPAVGESARVALVTFSDTGRTVLDLCDLAEVSLPYLSIEGGTNLAAGFRAVKDCIERGLRSLPKGTPLYRPVVFFMSDGEHIAREDWRPAHRALVDRASWKFAPVVVSFGFGDADPVTIKEVGTKGFSFLAKDIEPAKAVQEIMRALLASIVTTSQSLHDPAMQQGLHVPTDNTVFVSLDSLEV
jgi:uncharacterized protein YegL